MALYLPATLGPLARCAASDNGRYSMCGVQVADPGDGTSRCAVTDGRKLLVARGLCPQEGELGCPSDAAVVVPSAEWNELFRKVPKLFNGYPHGSSVPVGVDVLPGFKLRLLRPDRQQFCDPVDGRFPDWRTILPKGAPVFAIKVNPEYLIDVLATVRAMLAEDNQAVTLCFWKPSAPMAVVAKDGTSGVCLDGLLMPLVPDPAPAQKGAA
jgi:hypothetical protein